MNGHNRTLTALRAAAAALLALAAMAPSALGQGASAPEELRTAAERLFPQPARHAQAAELLCREAAVRPVDDPRGVDALILCGKLYFYSRDMARSRHALEEASRRALAVGDVVRAAHAMVDASLVAQKQGKRRIVTELTGRARLLARSPLLSSGERFAIESRVVRTEPKEVSS